MNINNSVEMERKSVYSSFESEISDEKVAIAAQSHTPDDRFWFYFWAICASLSFGTKMVWIGMSKINEVWLFFFEHVMLFLTGGAFYMLIRYTSKANNDSQIGVVFKEKAMLICCLISGVTNSMGNIWIIFAIHFCFAAGISPAAMNWLIMLNTVMLLIFGMYFFNERHTLMEYVGSVLVLIALCVITLQRKDSSVEENGGGIGSPAFYLAVLFTILCSISWGFVGFAAKYASYHYDSVVEEYSMVSMIVSGVGGMFSIIYIISKGVELEPHHSGHVIFYIIAAGGAGFFTNFGIYSFMKALSYGSVGVASLFANMQIIFELVEELIIFQILPSFVSFIGIGIALLGSSFMIIFQHHQSRGH